MPKTLPHQTIQLLITYINTRMHISTLEQLCIGMRWRMEMGTGDKWE